MIYLAFPVTVAGLILVAWLALAFIEVCIMGAVDAKFDCVHSLQIVFAFALIGSGLSGGMAIVLRFSLSSLVPIKSASRECIAAVISGIALVLVFYAIIQWKIGMDLPVEGRMLLWLAVSAVVCTLALALVHRSGARADSETGQGPPSTR